MTDAISLVEQTWAIAAGVEGVTDTFYNRLFEIRPDFKTTLFARTNLKAQAKMLASTIDVAVKHLRKPDVLGPVLTDLGKRHCQYGVRKEDYAPVAEALLWTLKHYLGAKYTKEVEAAWVGVLTTIAGAMGAPCDTAEGQRLLAEYDAKFPSPKRPVADPIKIVEETWAIAAAVEGVTETFYNRMWEVDPETKPLFARAVMKAQAKMLAMTIDVAVKHLREPEILVPILQDLGKRHCRYGVRKSDYTPGGVALLWTLKYYLKEKYTPAVEAAWSQVWGTIESVMGAESETPEGRQLILEYETRYPTPTRPGKTAFNGKLVFFGAIGVAIAAVALATWLRHSK